MSTWIKGKQDKFRSLLDGVLVPQQFLAQDRFAQLVGAVRTLREGDWVDGERAEWKVRQGTYSALHQGEVFLVNLPCFSRSV